jgi:carbamoyltransferase
MAAELIAGGKIIGWFQGRFEFGDRALGNRSILADPRNPEMKNRVNFIIKYREAFRPFAPAILAERVGDFFANAAPTPFMEKVFPIHAEQQKEIPAVTHVDGTGRLQTVTREQNPAFHALISHFDELTGVPVVLNTSFNLKGEAYPQMRPRLIGRPVICVTSTSSGADDSLCILR